MTEIKKAIQSLRAASMEDGIDLSDCTDDQIIEGVKRLAVDLAELMSQAGELAAAMRAMALVYKVSAARHLTPPAP